jgi:hypothetical protein
MSQYKIERWDAVLFGNSVSQVPMIYIKPDLAFKEFIQSNANAVVCEISGTGMIYDGKQIPGIADNSGFVPNCRPNFSEQTGYYVVTLWSDWYGYPEPGKLGSVVFKGLNVPANQPEKVAVGKKPKKSRALAQTTGMKSTRILVIAVALLVILLLIWLVSRKK